MSLVKQLIINSMEKKQKVDSLTFKNYHIYSSNFLKKAPLIEILDVPLHGTQARSRNRIIKLIMDKAKEIEESRMELIKKYCKKDKNGELVLNDDKTYKVEKMDEFSKEFTAMLEEDCILDVLPSNKTDLIAIKDVVLNSKINFDINGTNIYDDICKIFETL